MRLLLLLLIVFSAGAEDIEDNTPWSQEVQEEEFHIFTRDIIIEEGRTDFKISFMVPVRDVTVKVYEKTDDGFKEVFVGVERISKKHFTVYHDEEIFSAVIVFYSKYEWVFP